MLSTNTTFGLWARRAEDWGGALDTCDKLPSTSPLLADESTAPVVLSLIVDVQLLAMALDATASVATLADALASVVLATFPAVFLDLTASIAVAEVVFIFEVHFLRCFEWMPFFFAAFANLLPTT